MDETEYGVLLRNPNKRYSISKDDCIQRVMDYLYNIRYVRRNFIVNFKRNLPIIMRSNAAQKQCHSLQCHQLESKLPFSHRFQAMDYIHPSLVNDHQLSATRGNALPMRWKGIIQIATNGWNNKMILMFWTITPYIYNQKYVKSYTRDYILIVIGGGITGYIQLNDNHVHHALKSNYRQEEAELMIQKLVEDRNKIPSSNREVINLKAKAHAWLNIDVYSAHSYCSYSPLMFLTFYFLENEKM